MKVAVINKYGSLNKGQHMFFARSRLGMDLFASIREFRLKAKQKGIVVFSPENFLSAAGADVIIFLDFPSGDTVEFAELIATHPKTILLETELPAWIGSSINYSGFDLVLSYRPPEKGLAKKWEDYRGYSVDMASRDMLSAQSLVDRTPGFSMLATNHQSEFPGELYSFRRGFAKYMLAEFPAEFSLAGFGWDKDGLPSIGPVEDKAQFIKQRQFNVCTENCHEVPGFVTEKLLEAIHCGSVPIYFSTGHAEGIVPEAVYVNADQFNSISDLVRFCREMSDEEKLDICSAGVEWLSGESGRKFTPEFQAEQLIQAVVRLI